MKTATVQRPDPRGTLENLQPGNCFLTETCQFILDPTGVILKFKPSTSDSSHLPIEAIEGQPLRDILLTLNEEWAHILPKSLTHSEVSIFLPSSVAKPTTTGYHLHFIHNDSTIYVTLTHGLAPKQVIQDASIKEFPRDENTFASLVRRLQSSEGRLDNYMQNFPGVFFSQRPDFSFNFIGPEFEHLTGYTPQPFHQQGSRFINMIFEEDQDHFHQELKKSLQQQKRFNLTYRIRHKEDDNIRYILDVRTPIYSPSGLFLGYEGVWLDITRQSIAENHLSCTSWKESLATLTSGLVHDFSNVMAGIFSLAELYFDNLEEDHPMYGGLSQIKKQSQQAQKLVRRIMDLNREVSNERTYHNLENLIRDQLDLLEIILPKGCKIETAFTNEEIPVYLDDVSFRQLLLNMGMNTRDALGGKGNIKITVNKVAAGETALQKTVHDSFVAENDGIEIEFSDNGCGIPETNLKRVFEPFFTTKEVSKGSGFGLYNAKLFIEENKGRMGIWSEEGTGTTIHMFLPIATFNEIAEEQPPIVDTIGSNKRRPNAIIYGAQDPDSSELVNQLRIREWEVITFDRIDPLKNYLSETQLKPHALIAIKVGHDPLIESLIDSTLSKHPEIHRFMQVRGINPDTIPARLKNKVSAIFDERIQEREIVDKIAKHVT